MKKPVRLLLLGTGLLVVALVAALAMAFHSGVQTWAARKALAGQPALKASLGQISAGFQSVELKDLHLEQDGALIGLPSLQAEFSVIDAGLNQKINLRRLVAKGWTLDLTGYAFPAATASKSAPAAPVPAAASATATAAAQIFQGVFAQAALPFDLTLDGVELEGDVKLPPAPGVSSGRAHVVLKGGGLAAGREGAFTFTIAVSLTGADVPVTALEVTGRLGATMDTPRTFSRLATQAEAAATGPQFPRGVKLSTEVAANRTAVAESYVISLSDGTRPLVRLSADFPGAGGRLVGAWKIDLRDTDLAPFTLGRPLPSFGLAGEGALGIDPATSEIRTTGKLSASADKLGVVQSELAVLGAINLVAEFDLARRGDSLRVERLTAGLSGAQPYASVRALQAFEFNAKTGELQVADPTRDLLGLSLQGLPLAWAQPFVKELTVTGGDVRGEFVATARNGGFALRPKAPLTVASVSVVKNGKPLLRSVDVSLHASTDYTPQGWQVELAPLTVVTSAGVLLSLEAKAGQLVGPDQPVKATGKFSSSLPAVLGQPAAQGAVQLVAGDLAGDFVASLGAKQEIQAKIALTGLACDPKLTQEKLPSLGADLRADIAANGVITLNLPLLIERETRRSDLTLAGSLTPGKSGFALEARLTSTLLAVDDAQILAVPFATDTPPAGAKPAARETAPPWAGVSGRLVLALKKIVYSDTLQVTDVSGTVSLDAGAAKLVNFRAGLGDGADATIDGGLTYDAKSETPYVLAADLAVNEFDPAPLFKALSPGQPATVEGRFTVASKLSGRAVALADFASAAHGDFQLTSRGGVFRGLPVSYSAKVESAGKIAAGAAAIGSLIGSVTGKKEAADIANKAQAVAEISKTLAAIPYDQLNVVFTRDASLNTVLKDFTLISPEMRLSGGGQATHRVDAPLLEQSLAMEFKLRARGHTADLLKYLGKLEPTMDDLGYAGCTLPLKVAGTLGKPDTTELNGAIASLALEKSGVTDKASELFNKLLGGGK